MKRGVIYARVSSDDQWKNGDGPQTQINLCKKYAELNQIKVEKILRDDGISGAKSERAGFDELKKLVLQNADSGFIVLISEVSRIARDNQIGAEFSNLMIRTSTVVTSAYGTVYDFSKEEDEMRFMLEIIFSSFDRRKINKRVKAGMKNKLETGGWPFHTPSPQIWKNNKETRELEKLEPNHSIMADALRKFIAGEIKGKWELWEYINQKGIKMAKTPFFRFLEKPIISGRYKYEPWGFNTWLNIRIDPLLTFDEYEKLQLRLYNKIVVKDTTTKSNFTLAGYLYDYETGKKLTYGISNKSRATPTYSYVLKGKGFYKRVQRDLVEGQWIDFLKQVKLSSEGKIKVQSMFERNLDTVLSKKKADVENIKRRLTAITQRITKISSKMVDIDLESVTTNLKGQVEELDNEKARLEGDLTKAQETLSRELVAQTFVGMVQFLETLDQAWLGGNDELRKKIIFGVSNGRLLWDFEKEQLHIDFSALLSVIRAIVDPKNSNGGDGGSCTPVQTVSGIISFSDRAHIRFIFSDLCKPKIPVQRFVFYFIRSPNQKPTEGTYGFWINRAKAARS